VPSSSVSSAPSSTGFSQTETKTSMFYLRPPRYPWWPVDFLRVDRTKQPNKPRGERKWNLIFKTS
jgi:hypothetical protein